MTNGRPDRRFNLAPSEGWTTLLLVIVLLVTAAWSIDDSEWVLGRGGLTDFLMWVAIAGVVWGFLAGKAGWSRIRTYPLGAVMGALLVPIVVGSVLDPSGGSPGAWFKATADSTINAYLDLAWRNKALTEEYGHFLLVLGLLMWGTGMFAGYAAFGRRKPLNAVIVTALVLLVNMSITIQDQLALLVVFTIAALLLLARFHALDEQGVWVRRRLGDPGPVGSLYLRGGTLFAVGAILGSLILTSTASSAPLADFWNGADQRLVDLTQGLQRYLPRGGPGTKITGVSFGPEAAITGRWVTDVSPALQIQSPPGDTTPYYWAAVAYDQFDLNGWSLTDNVTVDRAAGASVTKDTAEAPLPELARRKLTVTVRPLEYTGSAIFSPDVPEQVDKASRITLVGPGQFLGALSLAGGSTTYKVTALVPVIGEKTPGGLTENKLRAAGTDYPDLVRSLYLSVPDGSMGPDSTALLRTIRSLSPASDPYDLAHTMEQYLRSPAFTYSTDVASLDCANRSVVECFAHYKQGYCQYYAATMTILLRAAGIPARYVQGFLPGERNTATGVELIRYSNSHAWVEAYFPGYGWVTFDPTGGGVAQSAPLPSGPPVPLATRTPGPSVSGAGGDNGRDPIGRKPVGPNAGAAGGPGNAGSATYVLIAILLMLVVGLAAFMAYRRGPPGPVSAEGAYRSVTRLAARLGFAPRPTETIYEYAASLAEALPTVRPELEIVADAKVEVAYGRRELGAERARALRSAYRRVRVAMLALVLRRPWRRRRR